MLSTKEPADNQARIDDVREADAVPEDDVHLESSLTIVTGKAVQGPEPYRVQAPGLPAMPLG